MPFIPHTQEEREAMLLSIGALDMEALFDEIPEPLQYRDPMAIPNPLREMEISRLMRERADMDRAGLCFIGAGAYEHHIPAAVWELAGRGEFYSAYTPYQAEASQGTLQTIFEFQSMISALTGMDLANASLYDGATALGEAVLMAVRAHRNRKIKRVVIPRTVHPHYRQVVRTLVEAQGVEIVEPDYDPEGGHFAPESLDEVEGDFTALVIPQPNFFGILEEVDALTDRARARGALVIGVVNPLALGVLAPPG
ncbi:MAG: glycine dehydrogenase, partial [Magnetococcales bacterium]|nr:glycine dehydrogenase [Magnetococcales bacterium]